MMDLRKAIRITLERANFDDMGPPDWEYRSDELREAHAFLEAWLKDADARAADPAGYAKREFEALLRDAKAHAAKHGITDEPDWTWVRRNHSAIQKLLDDYGMGGK